MSIHYIDCIMWKVYVISMIISSIDRGTDKHLLRNKDRSMQSFFFKITFESISAFLSGEIALFEIPERPTYKS